jgi:hypothetical protein
MYKMYLTEGNEEVYTRQSVTDEEKERINRPNIRYKAVPYGVDGDICNYIVMMINIPNSDNKHSLRFMNIFEIIKQYHVDPREVGMVRR